MNTVIIVQARMTSTRLPGKVLMEVLGKPLLGFQLERLARVRKAHKTVVATTVLPADQPILDFCGEQGVPVFRGSEQDVLSRYHGAAREFGADRIVRVTSDCPLIDPFIIDRVIGHLESHPELDYVSNVLERTYPRGLDCEAFPFAVLDAAFREAASLPEREHVTPFIHGQPGRFALGGVKHGADFSGHRWTVDTPEDFDLIRKMLEALYPSKPKFRLQDCLDIIAANPDWAGINAGVEQKKITG